MLWNLDERLMGGKRSSPFDANGARTPRPEPFPFFTGDLRFGKNVSSLFVFVEVITFRAIFNLDASSSAECLLFGAALFVMRSDAGSRKTP